MAYEEDIEKRWGPDMLKTLKDYQDKTVEVTGGWNMEIVGRIGKVGGHGIHTCQQVDYPVVIVWINNKGYAVETRDLKFVTEVGASKEEAQAILREKVITVEAEAVNGILDSLAELHEDLVKKWIYAHWPHGYGLFD